MPLPLPRLVLAMALAALSLLFLFWFRNDAQALAAMVLFAGPPLLLAAGVLHGSRAAAFWSGVFGLFWFSHGVMLAYDRPAERVLALTEVALALLVIAAANWPGLRARFGGRGGHRGTR
ncbi:hypothetical protein BH23PSE2_BH23PSE2_00200 [soil metagenome]